MVEKLRLVIDFDTIYQPFHGGLRPGAVVFVKTLRALYDLCLVSSKIEEAQIRADCKDIVPYITRVVGKGMQLDWLDWPLIMGPPIVFFGHIPPGNQWSILKKTVVPSAPRIDNDRHLHFTSMKFKQIAADLQKGLSAEEAVGNATFALEGLECSKLNWKPYYTFLGIKQAVRRTLSKNVEAAHITKCHSQWRVDVIEDQEECMDASPEEIRDYDRAQKLKRVRPDEILSNPPAANIFPLQKIREKKLLAEEKQQLAATKESDEFHKQLLNF
eukprot:GEMP01095469.1.p1 GENE.GEMP01095469.1~~GEMP01095469.1.p1  ORF type:complete len:286 (+),score=45.02 GEMP01095469.1:43-858(+)